MSLGPSQFAHFGAFSFDLAQRVLTRNGAIVPLAPKDSEVLHILIQSPNQIVEKEEILQKVWPDTFVEEANLSRHVFNLRRVLSGLGQPSIETVPKRGYRFVAPLRFHRSPAESQGDSLDSAGSEGEKRYGLARLEAPPDIPSAYAPPASRAIRKRRSWQLWVSLFAVIVVAGTMIGFVRAKVPHRVSIGVLPVQNLTGDPAKEYICDGLTEELIAYLGTISPSELAVVPRTTSMVYKTTTKTARQIAQDLQVDYLIEGSLRESGARFRITAQLIRFPGQEHVWTREFDRTPSDLIGMEDEISQSLAKLLADLHSDGGDKVATAGR
jgi:TolB-like protein/DNA-binding winged helix-turn-helix (wHTH) protein